MKKLASTFICVIFIAGCFGPPENERLYLNAIKTESNEGIEKAIPIYRELATNYNKTTEGNLALKKVKLYDDEQARRNLYIKASKVEVKNGLDVAMPIYKELLDKYRDTEEGNLASNKVKAFEDNVKIKKLFEQAKNIELQQGLNAAIPMYNHLIEKYSNTDEGNFALIKVKTFKENTKRKQLYEKASKLENENDIEGAIVIYKEIYTKNPLSEEGKLSIEKLNVYEKLKKTRSDLFEKLTRMAKLSSNFASITESIYEETVPRCRDIWNDDDNYQCREDAMLKSEQIATARVGYTKNELRRESQDLIYNLRQTGLSPTDIQNTLDQTRIQNSRGEWHGASDYILGFCCEGN